MSETQSEIPNAEKAEGGGKKKSKIKLILIVVILLFGAAGGFYYWRSSSAAAAAKSDKSEKSSSDKKSQAKKEPDDSEDQPDPEEKKSSKKSDISLKNALPEDEDVKKVVELPPFIVNLADSESARYLRMTISLGVGGEGKEGEKPDQLFITRVRNAMLAVLSEKKSDEILSVEGKTKLRKELLKAAQAASEEPHVEAIYITDFIVQL
ncbi:MAG: flagellar basal body-associated FliL family protein [Actinomycetota bacterium]